MNIRSAGLLRQNNLQTTYCSLANVERWREKWAGADSNCGYGHPKAEGYQATPPARGICFT